MLIRMSDATRVRLHNLLIELTLLVGVGYNLVLALINANVFTVRPVVTYAVEFMVYAACFLLGLGSLSRKRIALIVSGLGLIVTLMFVRFLVNWEIDPKFFRDALVVFAFVVLGSAYTGSVPKLFLRMTIIVSLVAAFELAMPTAYGDLVNPKSFFVNARGMSAEGFWNEDSNLFVSATRPGERNFLPGSNLPRASSMFIEPVTMGNYICFFTAILLVFWRWMRPSMLILSVGLIGFMVVASDGRLAAGTCVLMVLLTPLLKRLDQRLAFLVFLLVIMTAWLLVWMTGITAYQDTTMGRVFFTVYSMNNLSFESWMGLDFAQAYRYFDSGIAYFIASQSIVGVLAFLLSYSFLLLMPSKEGQLFKNLAIFAFALSLLVSNGYFSIKTSALWWFVCGYLWHMLPTWSAATGTPGTLIKDDPTADGAQLPLPAGGAR